MIWSRFKEVAERHLDSGSPPGGLEELYQKAELWAFNTDFSLEFPQPLLPNTVLVGGLLNKPAKPLDQVRYRTYCVLLIAFVLNGVSLKICIQTMQTMLLPSNISRSLHSATILFLIHPCPPLGFPPLPLSRSLSVFLSPSTTLMSGFIPVLHSPTVPPLTHTPTVVASGAGGVGVWMWRGGLCGGDPGLHGVLGVCGASAGGVDRRLLKPPAGGSLEVIPVYLNTHAQTLHRLPQSISAT